MSEKIRVAVLGACGRMGAEVIRTVCNASDMQLVGACDVVNTGKSVCETAGVKCTDVIINSDLDAMLSNTKPDVVVDFAKPFCLTNVKSCVSSGASVVIGTTGEGSDDLKELQRIAESSGVAVMVIPNFAVGAVLMMTFAAQAAKYMPNVEIIELHHDKKIDAPSGTSIKTAEMISTARSDSGITWDEPLGADDPARGEKHSGISVHSVRLPGLVAHQEVIFGGLGQTLTIKHDSLDRTSFMPGVLLAIRKAAEGIKGYVYGLDKIM
jgi:4-hydroxy-tetrahydrodipicolinate reductase